MEGFFFQKSNYSFLLEVQEALVVQVVAGGGGGNSPYLFQNTAGLAFHTLILILSHPVLLTKIISFLLPFITLII